MTTSFDAMDYSAAINAIASHWPRLVGTNDAFVRELIRRIPGNEWQADAWMIAATGSSFRSPGSPSGSAALPYFQAAESLIAAGASSAIRLPAILVHHSAALRSLGLIDSALAKVKQARSLLTSELDLGFSERLALQAAIALQIGLLSLHTGDYDGATTELRLAAGLSDHLVQADQVECFGGLALASFFWGDFEHAVRDVARARTVASSSGLLLTAFGAPAITAEVLMAVDRNRLLEAQLLTPQLATAAQHSDWEPLSLYAQATVSAINNQLIEALDLQRRAFASARVWQGQPVVRSMNELLRGGLLLHLGEVRSALEVLARITPTQNHVDCPAKVIASLRFGVGDFVACLQELQPCNELGDSHSSRTLIDVLLLTAAADYELGTHIAGDVAFDRALYLGSQTGIRVPFLVIPRVSMLRMLDRATDRNQPDAVHRLLDELRNGADMPEHALEPLSERERDIAQHLFQDKTVSQIAAELFISSNTVKTHVRSIYRKLSASNRKEAIRRVRELGLDINITRY